MTVLTATLASDEESVIVVFEGGHRHRFTILEAEQLARDPDAARAWLEDHASYIEAA